jgi:hypothetical protein
VSKFSPLRVQFFLAQARPAAVAGAVTMGLPVARRNCACTGCFNWMWFITSEPFDPEEWSARGARGA